MEMRYSLLVKVITILLIAGIMLALWAYFSPDFQKNVLERMSKIISLG